MRARCDFAAHVGRARRAGASAPAERRPLAQGRAVEALDLLEHAQAALDDEAQLPAGAAAARIDERRAESISSRAQATSSATRRGDAGHCRAARAASSASTPWRGSRRAAGRGGRARVDAEVLPEVGELQRAADRVGPRQRAGVVDAVEVQQQPADRIGRAPAVVEQLGAVGVACLGDVLRERVEQVVRAASRAAGARRMPRRSGPNTSGQRAAGPAGGRPRVECGAEGRQVGEAARSGVRRLRRRCRRRCGRSGRSPRSPDAARGGHEQRRDREVLVVIDSHGPDSPWRRFDAGELSPWRQCGRLTHAAARPVYY